MRGRLVIALSVWMALLQAAAPAADSAYPEPVSLPLEYYQQRGMIPQRVARRFTPPADLTSRTVALKATGPYSIDLTDFSGVENHSITIRNTGTADLVNPWVVMNGHGDWYNASTILTEALQGATAPIDKAWNIWHFVRRNRYHWYPAESALEIHDPAKFLNVYGYGFCDDSATNLECLWRRAGFTARCWGIQGHVISEVNTGDRYRMFDADLEVFYPLHDNRTVASVGECATDRTIIERVSPPEIADMYTKSTNSTYQGWWSATHTMAIRLRPGEALERCFHNWGKFHDNYQVQEPPVYGNGRLTYVPNFSTNAFKTKFTTLTNIETVTDSGLTPAVHVGNTSQTGVMVWRMAAPYVFVGGRAVVDAHAATPADTVRVSLAKSTGTYQTLGTITGPHSGPVAFPLDNVIATNKSAACYVMNLRVELVAGGGVKTGVGLNGMDLTGEIQCAPASLPTLLPRTNNRAAFRMSGVTGSTAEITHTYRATTATLHHAAPAAPLFPADGDTITTTAPVLAWESTLAPDEDRWRKVAVTWDAAGIRFVAPPLVEADDGGNTFAVPDGWLEPGNTYYWHVRKGPAADQDGPTWSFTVTEPPAAVADWALY